MGWDFYVSIATALDTEKSTAKGITTVLLLAWCQALASAISPLLLFVGSFIGADLSDDPSLATLPIAMLVVGAALGTIPMALAMQRFGRKRVFIFALVLSALATLALAESLAVRHFGFYCVCVGVLGFAMAALQQIRFAAMEAVPARHASSAASVVLLGGVVAAFVGPELGLWGQFLTAVEYQGSFYLAAAGLLLVATMLLFYNNHSHPLLETAAQSRPLLNIIVQPKLCLAVASAGIGFSLMVYVMSATPMSMHHHYGHSLADAKWVIQSHLAAMFLPSLLAPLMTRWFGLYGMMLWGLGLYAVCIIVGLIGQGVGHFWWALVLLGVGWNFLFVAGTSLLPQCYSAGEKFKVQAFNDAIIFSVQALTTLSAGWVLQLWGWHLILLSCLPLMMLLLLLLIWVRCSEKPMS